MKSYHLIEVKYLGATNTRGSKAKITSLRFPNDSLTVSLDYQYNNIRDQAIDLLNGFGFKISGYGYDEKKGVFILTSEIFEPIKELKGAIKLSEKKGRAWQKDHYNFNAAEKWEVKPKKRKVPARNVRKTKKRY
jgi:hypothetical protein